MIAIHKKTGNRYIILQEIVINKSEANDGQEMILYVAEDQADLDDPQIYIREEKEFNEKFERI